MCNDCKDAIKTEFKSEVKETPNEVKTELQELKISSSTDSTSDSEQIFYCEPFILDTDNLEDDSVQLDKDEFVRGLKDASHACGMYTALINSGFSVEDAVSYVFNFMNVSHNIETAKINANSSIEVSKNVAISKEKDML